MQRYFSKFATLLILSGLALLPSLALTIPDDQKTPLALSLVVIGLWVSELFPIVITTTLSALAFILIGAISWGGLGQVLLDPVLQLLLGSIIIAKGVTTSGLATRLASAILSSHWATRDISRLLLAFGLISTGISLFVSNTAVTAMLLPVGLAVINAIGVNKRPEAIGILLMLTWGSSVAVGVLVGSPPNLIAESALSNHGAAQIGFVGWMAFAMPINLLLLAAAWITLKLRYCHTAGLAPLQISPNSAGDSSCNTEPFTAAERRALGIFLLIILLWFLPDTLAALMGRGAELTRFVQRWVSPSNVALLGAGLFLLIPTRSFPSAPILSPRDLLRIDWRTMFLFAGGILLGKVLYDTGLANTLGEWIVELAGDHSQLMITALMVAVGILLSELTSNTAAASLLIPLALGAAQQAGVNPVAPVLGAALGTSLGFMMPISTPPNSIIYGSGLVPMRQMITSGIILDILGFTIVVLSLRAILPLLGWW